MAIHETPSYSPKIYTTPTELGDALKKSGQSSIKFRGRFTLVSALLNNSSEYNPILEFDGQMKINRFQGRDNHAYWLTTSGGGQIAFQTSRKSWRLIERKDVPTLNTDKGVVYLTNQVLGMPKIEARFYQAEPKSKSLERFIPMLDDFFDSARENGVLNEENLDAFLQKWAEHRGRKYSRQGGTLIQALVDANAHYVSQFAPNSNNRRKVSKKK